MPCSTGACGGSVNNFVPEPQVKQLGHAYSGNPPKRVKTLDGAKSPNQPLVSAKPTGGWGATFEINGHAVAVEGKRAQEVFDKLKQVLLLNKIEITDENLWLNLNLEWMERSADRHCLLCKTRLLSLAQNKDEENAYNPMVYGSKVWSGAEVYLAGEFYDEHTFRNWIEMTREILSDPLIGCVECLEHFDVSLVDVNLSDRTAARLWLWFVKNQIRNRQGRPEMTFERAAEKHNWFELVGFTKDGKK